MSVPVLIKGVNACVRSCPKIFKQSVNIRQVSGLLLLGYLLPFISSPALSHEQLHLSSDYQLISVTENSYKSSPPAMDTVCTSLLHDVHKNTQQLSMVQDRHAAGKQAAKLGLMFGAVLALGPNTLNDSNALGVFKPAFYSPDTGNGQALVIAKYRACKDQQALNRLRQQQ